MEMARRLILASSSESRRDLLRRAGYTFTIQSPGVDEPSSSGFAEARPYVQHVAWLKAAAVAARVPDGIVLAADSISWHRGEGLGKPSDRADARRILQRLSGTQHQLWTGVCLWLRPEDWQIAWQEASQVEMKALSAGELEAYLDSGVWQGASGGYRIQEDGDPYIRIVQGSTSNVIGLPLESLARVLASLNR
jgi:septum formation protein